MLITLDESRLPETEKLFLDVFSGSPWNDDWSAPGSLRAYLAGLTGNGNSLSLGYLREGELVAVSLGYVFNWWRGKEYYIREFCVTNRLQRAGIGSSFMTAVESHIGEMGLKSIILATSREYPAFGFYVKNGFRELSDMSFLAKEIG